MSNSMVSQRGTSLNIMATHPGFRRGFSDVRLGIAWPKDDLIGHGRQFRWWYEDGRLFVASQYSRRWQATSNNSRDVNGTLTKSLLAALKGGVWPAHDRAK